MPDPLPYESRQSDGTPTAKRICPKCGGGMLEGYILDRAHGAYKQCTWIGGTPEERKFLGLDMQSLNTTGRDQIPVTTYRCPSCGFLELYAQA
jgi:predicted RNA-binding Zn-ribbon protein involved in translation (DUF1610 family)